MKPDRSKTVDVFTKFSDFLDSTIEAKENAPVQPKNLSNKAFQAFITKLNNEQFDEFNHKDWLSYFIHKGKSKGMRYIPNYIKDAAVLKSLMSNFEPTDIKNMIDFIFDSNQDIVDRRTVGIWALSGGWTNTIYQNSQLWINGEYTSKKTLTKKPNREYKESSKLKPLNTPTKKIRL